MNHLDLFSGIGGFSLGLESTGHYRTVAFCEIEQYPRAVLRKHWPKVPIYQDVRDVGADRLAADGIGRIDIVTGGFPCQDISLAGSRAGLSGERSGLWSELFRVITEVRPRWAIIENVSGLRTLGADAVLADLAGADYAAWPLVVGAVHAGAPHRRQRVWIVAHSQRNDLRQKQRRAEPGWTGAAQFGDDGEGLDAADTNRPRLERHARQELQGRNARLNGSSHWESRRAPEPVLRRVDDGLPCGMDRRQRLKALGNAVVPQIVAVIGKAIIQAPYRCFGAGCKLPACPE